MGGQCSAARPGGHINKGHPLIRVSQQGPWGKIIAVALGQMFSLLEGSSKQKKKFLTLEEIRTALTHTNKTHNKKMTQALRRVYEDLWWQYKVPNWAEVKDKFMSELPGMFAEVGLDPSGRPMSTMHLDKATSSANLDSAPLSARRLESGTLSARKLTRSYSRSNTRSGRPTSMRDLDRASSGSLSDDGDTSNTTLFRNAMYGPTGQLTQDDCINVTRESLGAMKAFLPELLEQLAKDILSVLKTDDSEYYDKAEQNLARAIQEIKSLNDYISTKYVSVAEIAWNKMAKVVPDTTVRVVTRTEFVEGYHRAAFELLDTEVLLAHVFRTY